MKKGIAIAALCIVIFFTHAQTLRPPTDLAKVVPATPNATRITDFYAQQPGMYTGTANVNIPLYTIAFDGWSLPLAISYNATGIRANEEASEIGLGWALNATGVITRSVNGGDDFFDGGIGGFGKGYVVSDHAVTREMGHTDGAHGGDGSPPPSDSYYYKLASSRPDTQPDVFNYNFFGYSGSFVLTQKVLGPVKVTRITQDPCLINFDLAAKKFIITTPSGFKGTFDIHERSTTVTSSPAILTEARVLDCCQANYIDELYLKNSSGQFRTITSWYLSKIVSPRGKQIHFKYDMLNGRSQNVSSTRSFAERTEDTRETRVCIQTIQEHVYLLSIASDEIQINFQMSADRKDLRRNIMFLGPGENSFPNTQNLKRYVSVRIIGLNSSSLTKTIKLQQSYFNQSYQHSNNYDKMVEYLRLRLDRIIIDDQEYSFQYEKPGELPGKLTSGIDHFGFANGDISTPIGGLLPPKIVAPYPVISSANLKDTLKSEYYMVRDGRHVDFNYGKAGILNKVIYPTGGYTKFTYESHRYYPEQSSFTELDADSSGFFAGGTRIKTIEEFDYNDSLQRSREYYYVDDDLKPGSKTTGKIMTPLYSRYARVFHHPLKPSFVFERRSFSGIPGSHTAQGRVIGYSKVHEIVKGKKDSYRNTYYFENNTNTVLTFNSFASGTPNVNGQLIQTRNYDADGKLVQTTVNSEYNHLLKGKVLGIMYEPAGANGWYLEYHVPYTLERSFITPYVVTTTTGNLETKIMSTYNDSTRLLRSQSFVNSHGEEIKTEYKRPFDYSDPSPIVSNMKDPDVYMIDPVIEEIVSKDGQVLSATGREYIMSSTSYPVFVDLKRTYQWNRQHGSFIGSKNGSTFPLPYELKMTFDDYDNFGRIKQYTGNDGIMHSFIWGYNNTLPVVHGLNITYANLKAAYDTSQGSNYETLIRNHTNTIGKQITTYQHDPLVGVTGITSPSAINTRYTYDQYQRLKSIIDNDDNTLEQYEMNYRKVVPIYNASVSSSQLDWGVQVARTFGKLYIHGRYYENCASALRTVTISNTGTADINIEARIMSSAFGADVRNTMIMPGSSIPITVQFNPDSSREINDYKAQLEIKILRSSDSTYVKTLYVALHGELQKKVCPPMGNIIFDVGTTVSMNKSVDFIIPNPGNAGFRLQDFSWIENGQPFTPPIVWEFAVATPMPTGCIMPNAVATNPKLRINFHSPTITQVPRETTLVLKPTSSCPDMNVIVKGWRRSNDYWRHITTELAGPSMLEPAMEPSVTTTVRVSNDGENELYVTGITPNITDTTFEVSETVFTLHPGATKDLTIAFKPGLYDLNQHTITYTIVTGGEQPKGTTTFTLTGKRKPVRSVKLVVGGSPVNNTILQFASKFSYQYISVINDGNTSVGFTQTTHKKGISYSFPGSAGTPEYQSPYWSADLNDDSDFPPAAPPRTLRIAMRSETALVDPLRQYINIEYNSSSGVAKTYVEVTPWYSYISLPATVTLPGSESSEFSGAVTITNTGVAPLEIYQVTIGDPTRFSIVRDKPVSVQDPIIIPAKGSGSVAIKYQATPLDFTERSSALTFTSNTSIGNGNVTVVKAKRILKRDITITPAPLTFTTSNQLLPVTITNTGNNNQYISGWYWSNSSGNTKVSSSQYWSVPSVPPDFLNTSIAPGSSKTCYVRLNTYTANPESIAITFNSFNSGLADLTRFIKLETKFKIIGYPAGPIVFPSFSGDFQEASIKINAIGNEPLIISDVVFDNSDPDKEYFSILSPRNFTIPGGEGRDVVVRYTPPKNDFSQKEISLSTISNASTFSPSTRVSVTLRAKRTQTFALSYTNKTVPQTLTLKPSVPEITLWIKNEGNGSANISGTMTGTNANKFITELWYYNSDVLVKHTGLNKDVPANGIVVFKFKRSGTSYVSCNAMFSVTSPNTSGLQITIAQTP